MSRNNMSIKYTKKDLKRFLVTDLIDSFRTVDKCFTLLIDNKQHKGDIVVFKSPNLFIFNVIIINKDVKFIPLKKKYVKRDDNNLTITLNSSYSANIIATDMENNKIINSYGDFKINLLRNLDIAHDVDNVYVGHIVEYHEQPDDCYYMSQEELIYYINSKDRDRESITKEYLIKHSIKLESVKQRNEWTDKELKMLFYNIKKGVLFKETYNSVKSHIKKDKKQIQYMYYKIKKENKYRSVDSYRRYVYGTDEIFEDIIEYHELYSKMRAKLKEKERLRKCY